MKTSATWRRISTSIFSISHTPQVRGGGIRRVRGRPEMPGLFVSPVGYLVFHWQLGFAPVRVRVANGYTLLRCSCRYHSAIHHIGMFRAPWPARVDFSGDRPTCKVSNSLTVESLVPPPHLACNPSLFETCLKISKTQPAAQLLFPLRPLSFRVFYGVSACWWFRFLASPFFFFSFPES